MTATLEMPPATADRPKGRTWLKVLLAVGCLLMFAMWAWGYYLIFDNPRGVYQLEDKNWSTAAKAVCADARTQLASLTDTTGGWIDQPTVEQMRERADIVDRATDIVEKMLDDIVAIPVATDRDRQLLSVFEQNYRIVIADRRRYSASLREGKYVRYTETVVAGGPVSNVITDFTAGVKGNEVPDCSPPDDLANTKAP